MNSVKARFSDNSKSFRIMQTKATCKKFQDCKHLSTNSWVHMWAALLQIKDELPWREESKHKEFGMQALNCKLCCFWVCLISCQATCVLWEFCVELKLSYLVCKCAVWIKTMHFSLPRELQFALFGKSMCSISTYKFSWWSKQQFPWAISG